jgi:hypothetical protein
MSYRQPFIIHHSSFIIHSFIIHSSFGVPDHADEEHDEPANDDSWMDEDTNQGQKDAGEDEPTGAYVLHSKTS